MRQCMRPDRRLRTDVIAVSAHLPAVLIGLRWLYDTTQPSEATVDPQRNSLPSARGHRSLRFNPVGHDGAVMIEIVATARNELRDQALAGAELSAFVELVDGLGEEIVETGAGQGLVLGAVSLARPAHPSLLSAVARFRSTGRAGSVQAIDLAAVQRAVFDRGMSIQQFAGPWPESLDPSGVLRRVAGGAVARLASGSGGVGRS